LIRSGAELAGTGYAHAALAGTTATGTSGSSTAKRRATSCGATGRGTRCAGAEGRFVFRFNCFNVKLRWSGGFDIYAFRSSLAMRFCVGLEPRTVRVRLLPRLFLKGASTFRTACSGKSASRAVRTRGRTWRSRFKLRWSLCPRRPLSKTCGRTDSAVILLPCRSVCAEFWRARSRGPRPWRIRALISGPLRAKTGWALFSESGFWPKSLTGWSHRPRRPIGAELLPGREFPAGWK
jgi:hypothetical protein